MVNQDVINAIDLIRALRLEVKVRFRTMPFRALVSSIINLSSDKGCSDWKMARRNSDYAI